MSERKAGWYWVKKTGAWVPAYFYCETWVIGDISYRKGSFAIIEIGPRIPTPDEKKE